MFGERLGLFAAGCAVIRTLELGDLLFRFFLGDTVTFLDLADELLTLAFENRPIIGPERTVAHQCFACRSVPGTFANCRPRLRLSEPEG